MHSVGFVHTAMPSITNLSRLSCPIQNYGKDKTDWGITKTRKNENRKRKRGLANALVRLQTGGGEMKGATRIMYSRRAGIARTSEESQITSAHDRIKAIRTQSELNRTTSLIAPAEHDRNSG